MDLKEPLIKANRVLKYSITYQETDEESREVSDFSDSGFIIENETDEIGNILKLAVETYGIYYPVAFGWWESTYPVQNKDYFEKGIEIYYALHITNEDGTDITENESDFITFLLSDGNYNKDEFTEYAIGGIVTGAIALGIGGLIAYYYFNKGKGRNYPTGRAWTKEHYNDNDDEDYEISPNQRNIKHKARNRQFDGGGGVGNSEIKIATLYGKMLNELSKEKQFNKKLEKKGLLDNFSKSNGITIDNNNIIYVNGVKVAFIDKINQKTGQEKSNWEIKKYDNGGRVKKMYYHIIEYGDYGNIGYQGYYETKEEAQKQVDKLSDYFPNQTFQIFVDNSKKEPPITTMKNGGGVENAEMPMRERTTITRPTTTPTTTPSKPDKKNPYKPKHIPKPKARK